MASATANNKMSAICERVVKRVPDTKKEINIQDDVDMFQQIFHKEVAINAVICGYCRVTFYKHKRRRIDLNVKEDESSVLQEDTPVLQEETSMLLKRSQTGLSELSLSQSISSISQSSTEDPTVKIKQAFTGETLDPEYIEVQIQRTVATHKYCCICNATGNITLIPQEARIQSCSKRRIYIPPGNRCCQRYLINKRFYQDDLNLINVFSNSTLMEANELRSIMEHLAVQCSSTQFDQIGAFRLSDEQMRVFTGLTWKNILDLRDLLKSMRNNSTRSVTQALVVFLFKLRTGNSNKLISSFLQLEREQAVSDYSASIVEAFETDILSTRFGCAAAHREELIKNHTTAIAKELYNASGKLLVICDGTYARHQKSANNDYQRKSYSVQKKVPLCKPFTVCTMDGYIIDMLGPYLANQNDAVILKEVMNNANGLSQLMAPGDIFVVDRGFRDVKQELENKGFQVLMPALKGKRNQLSTIESNQSRFVTKIRWPVEAWNPEAEISAS